MKEIDTSGNEITRIIPNCRCESTGGCERCNPSGYRPLYKWGKAIIGEKFELFDNVTEEEVTAEEKKRFYENAFGKGIL